MPFQRSNYRTPLNPADNPKPKRRRIIVGADLPEYMHKPLDKSPEKCPLCNGPISDDIREAAAHILGCARDEKKQTALKGKNRS